MSLTGFQNKNKRHMKNILLLFIVASLIASCSSTKNQLAKFNGGDPNVEFQRFVKKTMIYPTIASENGISGRVLVQFVVNGQGEVVDAVVVGSVDPSLDKEALRVILSSPKWTPGKEKGKPVKLLYTFPINFVLQ